MKGFSSMKKEISLNDLLKAMLQKVWLIIVLTVVVGILAYSLSAFVMTPKYTSQTELYVYNPKESGNITTSDINLSRYLINTYIRILTGNTVVGTVADQLNDLRGTSGYEFLSEEEYTLKSIKDSITASAIDNTEIISVKVTTDNPDEAQLINKLLFETLQPEAIRVAKVGAVEALFEPTLPTAPSSPSILKNTAIGALLGFVIAAAIIVILFMFDSAVHDEQDLASAFEDVTILGVIPIIQATKAQTHGETSNQANN